MFLLARFAMKLESRSAFSPCDYVILAVDFVSDALLFPGGFVSK